MLPTASLAKITTLYPGWLKKALERRSGFIDSQLIKRYVVPFAAPYPEIVLDWLENMVTYRCFLKVGVSPTDEQFVEFKGLDEKSELQIKEAADAVNGLFELPLRGAVQDGAVKASPLASSEQSPYAWTDQQRTLGVAQDDRSRG